MSLINVGLSSVVRKQFRYKLKAYSGVLMALIVIQVIGILISLLGIGNSSFSNELYTVEVIVSSPNLVIILTMIWALMNAILVTTKVYREDDFTFVSNQLSYHLSNLFFLLTVCLIGAMTALLSTGVIRVLMFLTRDIDIFLSITREVTISDYITGFMVTLFFVLMSATAGYLLGMMAQYNKGLVLLIPVVLIAINYIAKSNNDGFINVVEFYFMEHNFSLFVLKSFVTVIVGCGLAIIVSNRLEVRK